MRSLFGLSLMALLGCAGTGPGSSLEACDFDQPCALALERCYVSQICGPPVQQSDGGFGEDCGEVTGDRRCHLRCEQDGDCSGGERCTDVTLAERSDVLVPAKLCLTP